MCKTYLPITLCTHIPIISLVKIPRNEIAGPRECAYFYNWVRRAQVSV